MKSTKRIKPKRAKPPKVALKSPVVKEDLPFPHVHYPNHYGTFFLFSETIDSQPYFCSCNVKAIQNHFHLRKFEDNSNWAISSIPAPLSSHFFPTDISLKSKILNPEEILVFKDDLCHRCNMKTPSLRYCHEMYGGNFKQYYGWYINQTSFRLGIRGSSYIKEYTPDELIIIVNEYKDIQKKINDSNYSYAKIHELEKQAKDLYKKITHKIENTTRKEFGFCKIGEGNLSESILTKIIEGIYSNYEVKKHYRPKWLEGLELDIFIPELNLGIEYQGQQHFYPVELWGGQEALVAQQERDSRKRKLCKLNNIKLIEVDYTEPLELEYIKNKLCSTPNIGKMTLS